MQSVIRWALAALLLSTLPALADTMPNPYVVGRVVRCSGTITSGGSSQTAISATANTGSKFLFIQNPSNASEDLFVDMGESATSSGSIDLPAGSVFSMGGQAVWQGSVTVFATTTAHAFNCFYGD